MIDLQEQVRLLEAVRYIKENSDLSFHHVSIKFSVDVQKLQDAYRLSRVKMPQSVEEL